MRSSPASPRAAVAMAVVSCAIIGSHLLHPPEAAASVQFIPGNAYAQTVEPLLQSANASIDIVQFNFGEATGLAEKLIAIKKQHAGDPKFRIRVLVEKDGFGAAQANQAALQALSVAGFAANPATPQPYSFYQVVGKSDSAGNTGITHTKLVLVDGRRILAGSTNWTVQSITQNNETDLLIDSSQLGNAVLRYIQAVQERSDALDGGAVRDGGVTMFEDQAYLPAILEFLAGARKGDRLDCSMYLFNVGDPTAPSGVKPADDIAAALKAAAARGVQTRLMLETGDTAFSASVVAANKRAVSALGGSGISIFWDDPDILSHMKFCARTRREGGYRVILGSTNWNYLDIDLNHQLNWLVHDADGSVAAPLLEYFQNALGQSGVAPASAP